MDRVRLAVLGCGDITEKQHLPAIASHAPEIELVAIYNRTGSRLNLLGDRYRIPSDNRFTDYHELLRRKDIKAILVAISPEQNYKIVAEAALNGKDIFVEKPMARTATEARSMVKSVKDAGVRFQVGFNKRFYYGYRKAKELIMEERIGFPTGISGRFWFEPSPKTRNMLPREQVVMQNGIHFLDLLQFLMGPAQEVFAREQLVGDQAGTVSVSVLFQSGAVGSALLSSCGSWQYPDEWLDVVGSNGCCLSVGNGRKVNLLAGDQRGRHFEQTISAHWNNDEAGFARQLKAFARGIQSEGPEEVGPQDGLRSVLLAEAVLASLRERRPIEVPQA